MCWKSASNQPFTVQEFVKTFEGLRAPVESLDDFRYVIYVKNGPQDKSL